MDSNTLNDPWKEQIAGVYWKVQVRTFVLFFLPTSPSALPLPRHQIVSPCWPLGCIRGRALGAGTVWMLFWLPDDCIDVRSFLIELPARYLARWTLMAAGKKSALLNAWRRHVLLMLNPHLTFKNDTSCTQNLRFFIWSCLHDKRWYFPPL